MSTTVYIVGFPKSGNTWLTRLLADALHAPVARAPMRGFVELASEINDHLAPIGPSPLQVAKVHFLPTPFAAEVEANPTHLVYIHRDPRDVAVSAFFHFTRWTETDLSPSPQGVFRRIVSNLRRQRARRDLDTFTEQLMLRGLPGVEDAFGTWASHIDAWSDITQRWPTVRCFYASYEALRAHTKPVLQAMLNTLNLEVPSSSVLDAVIDRQSFQRVREHYRRMSDNAAVPLGRSFALRFYRGGRVGDGHRLLSDRALRFVESHCAAAQRQARCDAPAPTAEAA